MTANTTRAGPSTASETAKQSASLDNRTSRPTARTRSASTGRPFSQVELAPLVMPVRGSTDPGIPTPTDGPGATGR